MEETGVHALLINLGEHMGKVKGRAEGRNRLAGKMGTLIKEIRKGIRSGILLVCFLKSYFYELRDILPASCLSRSYRCGLQLEGTL